MPQLVLTNDNEMIVADIRGWGSLSAEFSVEQATRTQDANGRLIAAAPELLEACQGLLAIVSDSRGVDGYHRNGEVAEWDEFPEIDAALNAIAKATGEER